MKTAHGSTDSTKTPHLASKSKSSTVESGMSQKPTEGEIKEANVPLTAQALPSAKGPFPPSDTKPGWSEKLESLKEKLTAFKIKK